MAHSGHNMTTMMPGVMNNTMAMMMGNVTGMDHGHGMHNMSMDNSTEGMDHSMNGHGHMGHDTVTEGNMHGHHGMTEGNMDMGDHGGHGMTGGTMDMGGHGGHGSTVGHSAYFNFQLPINVLFFGWEVTSQGQLAGACVAWCILAIVYEGLKNLREHILSRMIKSEKKYLVRKSSKRNGGPGDIDVMPHEPSCIQKIFNGWHILLSFLQIIHTTLGMLLMLVYMTFNVWLAISVSLGSGVGYWLFAWNKRSMSQYDEDHCM